MFLSNANQESKKAAINELSNGEYTATCDTTLVVRGTHQLPFVRFIAVQTKRVIFVLHIDGPRHGQLISSAKTRRRASGGLVAKTIPKLPATPIVHGNIVHNY